MRKLFYPLIIAVIFVLGSCSKSSDSQPARTKPMLGTKWTYWYKKFDATGVLSKAFRVIYQISAEQTVNNETWFTVTDSTQSAIFVLTQRADGLYHLVNSTPYLLCKYPANVNDTYNSYNNGDDELVTVKETGITVNVPKGDIVSTRYEGEQGGVLKDILWYNPDVWLVKKETYVTNIVTQANHIDTRIELIDVQY